MQIFQRNSDTVNKKFIEYFLPTVLTAMATNLALIVDSIIVGNMLGSSALAAINLLSPIIQLYFSLTLMYGLGASTLISIAKGERNETEGNQVFTLGFIVFILLSILMMAGQMAFIDPIVSMLTQDAGLQGLIKEYYIPYIIGTPFTFLLTAASYCVRTDGRPKLASNAVIIANVVNLISDVVLIGYIGIGIKGASIATVMGNVVGFLIICSHFISKKNTLRFDFSGCKNGKLLRHQLWNLTSVGASGALGAILITVRMAFLNTYVQQLGEGSAGVVALSINSSCQILISAFITGASQTMIPIVGVMLGQKDYDGVRMALKKTWKILLAANAAILVLLEAFPETAARIFGVSDMGEIAVVVPSIRITTLSFVGLSASFMLLYYFMAIKKKSLSTMISVINGVALIIPFSVILGNVFGLKGVWWAFVITQIGTLLIAWIAICVQKLRSKGKYKDLYLLEEVPKTEIMSISFSTKNEEVSRAVKFILQFMKENGVSDTVAMKITMAIEEMAVSIPVRKNNADIDVRVGVNREEINISLRDNGLPHNPIEVKPEIWQELDVSGMGIVKAIVKNMEYSNVIGFNQTTLIIENN